MSPDGRTIAAPFGVAAPGAGALQSNSAAADVRFIVFPAYQQHERPLKQVNCRAFDYSRPKVRSIDGRKKDSVRYPRSVLNAHNQAHDVPNLFVCDTSVFVTGAGVNPTLTAMAIASRAADEIVRLEGRGPT